jgi:hypothetical protein
MDSRLLPLSEIPAWAGVLLTVADAFHLPWLAGAVWAFVIGSALVRRLANGRRLRLRHLRRHHGPAPVDPAEAGPVEAGPVEAGPVEAGPVE